MKLAVFLSGGGSNLQSMIDKVESGALAAEIGLVLSNKPDVFGVERAKKHGIETVVVSHKDFGSREEFDRELVRQVKAAGCDTVALAGFMRVLTSVFLEAFPGRVVNIHPALLPSFAGIRGQGDAADHGVKLAGCTVHFVDEIMDHGPIIIQAAVPVVAGEGGDTLGKRILALEHRCYPQALQWLAEGRLRIEGRHVFLDGEPKNSGAGESESGDGGYIVNPPLEKGF
jgi:phosphoribosylglycinamide formyltransferase 1